MHWVTEVQCTHCSSTWRAATGETFCKDRGTRIQSSRSRQRYQSHLETFCSDLWVGLLAWDVFPSISSLPLLGNSFSVFVGFEIGPLVVKDIQQEKDRV